MYVIIYVYARMYAHTHILYENTISQYQWKLMYEIKHKAFASDGGVVSSAWDKL